MASGLPLGDVAGEVMAMWYLGPANGKTDSWPFSVAGLGLTEGDQLRVYNASYGDFEWVDLGVLTADAEGNITSTAGLKHLSTLILVKE